MSGGDIRFVTIPTGTPALDTPVDGIAVQVNPTQVQAFVRDTIRATDTVPEPDTVTTAPATPVPPTASPTATSTASTPTASTTPTTAISAAGVTCVD
jgi:hypothetical protein